jgi:hypothetical protein
MHALVTFLGRGRDDPRTGCREASCRSPMARCAGLAFSGSRWDARGLSHHDGAAVVSRKLAGRDGEARSGIVLPQPEKRDRMCPVSHLTSLTCRMNSLGRGRRDGDG